MKQKAKANKPATGKPVKKQRHAKRDLARVMFISSEMTVRDISMAIEVSEQTLGTWRKEDNWDEERTLRNTSPIAIIKRFNEELEKLMDARTKTGESRALTSAEVDMIAKLTKAIKNLRNQLDPQTVMEALNGFMHYLSVVDLNLAQAIAPKAIAYVQVKLKESKER